MFIKGIDPNREKEYPDKSDDFDTLIFENADYFTVFRYGGPFNREKQIFHNLLDAFNEAENDKRAIVYAVAKESGKCWSGQQAMLVRKRWAEYKQRWNEKNG